MAILEPVSEGAVALDLFAGTGRVGLRLLDQGAETVVFVEGERGVAQDLRRTLKQSEHQQAARLVVGKIPKILAKVKGRFSLILADPPYDWGEPHSLLPALSPLAEPGALVVVEHHHKTPYAETAEWSLERQQKFGETRLSFFRSTASDLAHSG